MIASRFEVQQWWHKEKDRNENLSEKTIIKWYSRLMETGSVCDAKRQRVSPARLEKNIIAVSEIFTKSSGKSIRQVTREIDLSYSSKLILLSYYCRFIENNLVLNEDFLFIKFFL